MTTGRTALITGASGGIGRAFAETLARAGLRLLLLDLNEAGLAAVAAAAGAGAGVRTAAVDVTDRARLATVVADLVGADGGLDLVVNCAAILGGGMWTAQPADVVERVMRVDFLGTVNVTHACLPALRRARGHAVLVASTAAVHGWPGLAGYSAAKFALVVFAEGIRAELAREGVGLSVVFPLLIDTPLVTAADVPRILRRGRRLPPQVVVDTVLRAVARRRFRVWVPASVRFVAWLHALVPGVLDWYGERAGLEPPPRPGD